MIEDIKFLKGLQHELNNQEIDGQASPRFWVVGDYKYIRTSDDNAQRYSVYLPDLAEAYEINEYLKDVKEDGELPSEAFEETIECEVSALEWIQRYVDEGASLIPEEQVHRIHKNTMFLTKAEAQSHIEQKHYHYTDRAHTYAMTAWRAPKAEKLFKILSEFDWDSLKIK